MTVPSRRSNFGYAIAWIIMGLLLVVALLKHKAFGSPIDQNTTIMLVIAATIYISCGWIKLSMVLASFQNKLLDNALKCQMGVAVTLVIFPLLFPV